MNGYFDFINSSVTPYHVVENIADKLLCAGFSELFESDSWQLSSGGKYFVRRNGSSIIAFAMGKEGFEICATHSDFPSFYVKSVDNAKPYIRFATEKYGAGIHYSWLDRPLGIAGRATVACHDGARTVTVDMGCEAAVIPSVAIHLRRDVNDGCKLSAGKDMLPLVALGENISLKQCIAERLSVSASDILSTELYLYNGDKARRVGLNGDFILSPRQDNLICTYAALSAFLSAKPEATPVLAVFDNEEVGSETKQGAASGFLSDVLRRICKSEEEYLKRIAASFMISADNAHARHPNYPELSDNDNAPVLDGGVVVKYNANRAYATDAVSDGAFRALCRSAGVKLQSFFNRADQRGGSTLGSISNTRVSVPTVDIGLPQLAMHSANELSAAKDVRELEKALKAFYNSRLSVRADKIEI